MLMKFTCEYFSSLRTHTVRPFRLLSDLSSDAREKDICNKRYMQSSCLQVGLFFFWNPILFIKEKQMVNNIQKRFRREDLLKFEVGEVQRNSKGAKECQYGRSRQDQRV